MGEKYYRDEVVFANQTQRPKYYVMTSESGYSSAEYSYPFHTFHPGDTVVVSDMNNALGNPIPANSIK